ncbi:MAG: hypothetical protein WDO13_02925, partial [Verrucomicrobiota bacterium]
MALFSFGKKKEKAPEPAAPRGKSTSCRTHPPKIQTPAVHRLFSPHQTAAADRPDARRAHGRRSRHDAAHGRPRAPGPRASNPPAPARRRRAQRSASFCLPRPADARPRRPLAGIVPAGKINLPIGMILRVLPSEVLASDMAEFEKDRRRRDRDRPADEHHPVAAPLRQGGDDAQRPPAALSARLPPAGRGDLELPVRSGEPAAHGRRHAHPAGPCWPCVPTRRRSTPP